MNGLPRRSQLDWVWKFPIWNEGTRKKGVSSKVCSASKVCFLIYSLPLYILHILCLKGILKGKKKTVCGEYQQLGCWACCQPHMLNGSCWLTWHTKPNPVHWLWSCMPGWTRHTECRAMHQVWKFGRRRLLGALFAVTEPWQLILLLLLNCQIVIPWGSVILAYNVCSNFYQLVWGEM